MPFLSIHTLSGNPDELLQRKQEYMDPVVRQIAPEYGAIKSITVRQADGLMTINLWESAEGAQAFTQRPEVQQAQARSGLPRPATFERYTEVYIEEYQQKP
ncbi:hypothetical protein KDH_23020 [Dictyobacter sp. S3.2.2.5]|uniref:ABM domain-containing protein n=1 Tax=Dictyobacter halimunensis TaxID=3026934 RepID=A0ABQ6FSJ6_9CHLR|nr:hypothetical protein KDH_23020 [Dictyobacter sp. S3.2.2.5]